MKKALMTTVLAGFSLWSLDASAETTAGRYSMQKTDSGIARLDTETGEVSLCQEKDGQMVCRMAADERSAFELELDLLAKRVETLEKAVQEGPLSVKPRLPTKEEIDQTMTVMERMMRNFMGIVKDLEGQGDEPAQTPGVEPQKT